MMGYVTTAQSTVLAFVTYFHLKLMGDEIEKRLKISNAAIACGASQCVYKSFGILKVHWTARVQTIVHSIPLAFRFTQL